MARRLCQHCGERPAGLGHTICWECRDEIIRGLRPLVPLDKDGMFTACPVSVSGKYGAFTSGYRRMGAHREG